MAKKKPAAEVTSKTDPICGLVMPISTIEGLPPTHWLEVKEIISESVRSKGFEPLLVSDSDESGIIQARIVQNLYNYPIAVVDVSCKNPNVMFELGMRLAFDKPTVVIKDEQTDYSFDTSPLEHVGYPRDLRYSQINDFKSRLAEKVHATYEKSRADKNYSSFLKNFQQIVPSQLHTQTVSQDEFIIKELATIRSLLTRQATQREESSAESLTTVFLLRSGVRVGPFPCVPLVIKSENGQVQTYGVQIVLPEQFKVKTGEAIDCELSSGETGRFIVSTSNVTGERKYVTGRLVEIT